MLSSALLAVLVLSLAIAFPIGGCPPISGTFSISLTDLYPESAGWDPIGCRLYISSLYNSSLVIYDPYSKSKEIVSLPGITNDGRTNYTKYHLNGIDYFAASRSIYIAASSADAFTSTDTGNYSAANYTGPNHILRYDTRSHWLSADVALGGVQAEFRQRTGALTSGFQDMAEDLRGNSYAIGTFGNSIAKISAQTGEASLWYYPKEYSKTYGFGGIFAHGNKIVVSDLLSKGLVVFDTTAASPTPKYVKPDGMPANYPLFADGLVAPSKYDGKIALWSDDYNGTSVYGSTDGWESAKYLGLVLNDDPAAAGGFATDTFEIGESIFTMVEFFQFELPVQGRTEFPFFDITAKVDEIVKKSGLYV